jgi:5'-3' exonuclease
LRWQLGHLSRVTRALGIQPVSAATFEADDVIGTLAHAACQTATSTQSSADDAADSPTTFDRVIILSSDKDFIQCVNERVSLLSPKPGGGGGSGTYVFLHAHEVAETVGVRPERFADYLVLLGDVVDGIPGVTGIGPVRAKQIVEQYASLEHAMHDIKTKRQLAGDKKGKASDKVCAALLKAEAQLPLWRDLATIRTNVPDLPDWEALRYHGPTNGAAASDKPNTAAARALAAAAAEAVSAVPLTAAQQMTADTVAALYREFSFPSLPSFVPAATPSSGVAVTASSSSLVISSRSSRSSSSSASSLPRLLTQAQWSHLQRNGTMAEPPAAGATTAATVAGDAKGMKAQPKKRASVSDEAEAPKPKTARSKKQKLNDKGSSRAPPMGLSVEQIDG